MKNKNRQIKTIYYTDERNDEFSGVQKKAVDIGDSFCFVHKNIFWRAAAFFVYRIIMTPFAYIYCKLKFGAKTVGREKLKESRGRGCFLYCNHTLLAGDAFLPNVSMFPKTNYVIVNSDNVATPGTKNFVQMCGAIPVPQSGTAYRSFLDAIEKRVLQKCCVTVYPEAHIWPYYTGIRNFPSTSFRFPVKYDAPVYVSTTTFQAKKHGSTPRVTVFIDGPFYPDMSSPREAAGKLRDTVYSVMCRRSENSTYEAIKYVRKDKSDDKSDVRGQPESI